MKLYKEFKAFITKGNVLDLAIGVIIGGAFNSIVTTLNKNILMPVINLALSNIPSMSSGLYTILPNSKVATASEIEAGVTAILGPNGLSYTVLNYIDWSAFFEAILNFFFIALTLFIIVKVAKYLSKKRQEFEDELKKKGQPTPAPIEPVAPTYTTSEQLLMDIKALLEKQNEEK